jgi:hypothetical protein
MLVVGIVMVETQPTVGAAEPPPPLNVTQVTLPLKPPAKLSSHLDALVQANAAANATTSAGERSVRAGLAPSGAGSLTHDANNNPVVDVRVVSTSQAVLDELTAHGADVLSVSPQYRNVTLAIDQSRIVDLSNLASVEYVAPVLRPMTAREFDTPLNAVASAPAQIPANATCGSVTSEADTQLGAETARTQFGVDGTGVKVGILSDSFARDPSPARTAAQDVASGDLPGAGNPCSRTTAVQIVKDTVVGIDEGRAMAQAVHDLAPGASLAFATAFVSETDFAAQITALRTAGATVITDDITNFVEPFYQDGPIAVAANNARAAGVILSTSAANSHASFNGYEALALRPVTCQPPLLGSATCHNFSGTGTDTSYNFTLAASSTTRIVFQWAEPRFGVTRDLDIYLVNTATNTIVAQSIDNNLVSGVPFEFISYTNPTTAALNLALVVRRFTSAGAPRFKIIFIRPSVISNVQFATPNAAGDTVGATIFGHNGAASELVTAATAFNDGVNPEDFTSHGPVTYLFGPVTGTTPASAISPVTVQPTIAATDGGANTFFGNPAGTIFRFFGTSQAAPHAAAVAALLRQKKPSATPDELENLLTATATPMNGGIAVVGAGRVNAVAALNALAPPAPTCPSSRIGRTLSTVTTGRLQVNLTTSVGAFSSVTTTGLSNATLEVNGATLPAGSSVALSGTTATVFVQRSGAGGPFTARFSVMDGCGTYPLFFGKGS